MKDFCVIGSGISGATIANHLSKKYIVDVYDKQIVIDDRDYKGDDLYLSTNIDRMVIELNKRVQGTEHEKNLELIHGDSLKVE